jgi:hypothetical protein
MKHVGHPHILCQSLAVSNLAYPLDDLVWTCPQPVQLTCTKVFLEDTCLADNRTTSLRLHCTPHTRDGGLPAQPAAAAQH